MPTRLHCEGSWPGPLTLRRGWSRATARPWNDEGRDVAVRLDRGSFEFLGEVSLHLSHLGSGGDVFSPALYRFATRVWKRAGYQVHTRLDIMQRSLTDIPASSPHRTVLTEDPSWDDLVDVDRRAFAGFWRMSRAGLIEAMRATPKSAVLQIEEGSSISGYAVVGTQMSVAFLQRVAVRSTATGRGMGTSLIRASMRWAKAMGAHNMMLNLRPENERARGLYLREGFRATGSDLEVLRYAVPRSS